MKKILVKMFLEYDEKYANENNIGMLYNDFLGEHGKNGFVRGNNEGHFTGSIFIFNKKKTKILLMHHKKLKKWLQFGGHADGDMDIQNVALRELEEESGISCNRGDLYEEFLDLDRHVIPLNTTKGEGEHYHYDVRFAVLVEEDIVFTKQESEVNDIKWFTLNEVKELEKMGQTHNITNMFLKL